MVFAVVTRIAQCYNTVWLIGMVAAPVIPVVHVKYPVFGFTFALLAGIMLDTKNFVIKTGVRTFEAAAYLRKKGANTLTVKEMFSDSIETYREKVDIVCKAKTYRACAISTSEKKSSDVRLPPINEATGVKSSHKSSFALPSQSLVLMP